MVNLPGLVALACLAAGPALAWLRIVPALPGFGLFVVGGLLGVVVAVAAVIRAARGRGLPAGGVAGIVAATVFLVVAARGVGQPRINDFTTDLEDPPMFAHAATLPSNRGRDMAYPPGFATIQQACCSDLRPARVRGSRDSTLARARKLAESMPGWSVMVVDTGAGTLEAIAQTPLFGFKDDIVIRVRPEEDGTTRVDVRSKSRDGKGDIGANAARIRAFVAALEGATNSGG